MLAAKAVSLSDGRGSGGELVVNPEFQRFARHWDFHPRACRPRRPRTKGKVERPIRHVRDGFFHGRRFVSDEDLNEQAVRWLEGTANVRRHGTTRERPLDRFERDERPALKPLVNQPCSRLGAPPVAPSERRPLAAVDVQRRPLSTYAEAVR